MTPPTSVYDDSTCFCRRIDAYVICTCLRFQTLRLYAPRGRLCTPCMRSLLLRHGEAMHEFRLSCLKFLHSAQGASASWGGVRDGGFGSSGEQTLTITQLATAATTGAVSQVICFACCATVSQTSVREIVHLASDDNIGRNQEARLSWRP